MPMTRKEEMVREIYLATDISQYSHYQCQQADEWVKRYALRKLHHDLVGVNKATKEFILLMARCHYGSVETDEYLTQMGCYPEWIKREQS